MTIGAKIESLRRERKLSRKTTAKAAGTFSMDSLRRWEIGEQSPRVDDLKRLAEVLGVKIEKLLENEEEAK